MKRISLSVLLALTAASLQAQTAVLDVDASSNGITVSPTLYGIFYEEINHAGEGGLYAELLQNRSFEDQDRGIPNRRTADGRELFGRAPRRGAIPHWKASDEGVSLSIITDGLMNDVQTRAAHLVVTTATKEQPAGIVNDGYWGIGCTKGDKYTLSFWARTDEKAKLAFTVGLTDDSLGWTARKSFRKTISSEWKQYTVTFKGKTTAGHTAFAFFANKPCTLDLDMVSLFPPTFKGRENGCRRDLAEKLAELHPKFMRFPGGCYVEGCSAQTAYEWKRTVGPQELRPGHFNQNWGYPVSDGMGYHEYLQLAEDLGAEPLYVVNVGIWHGGVQPYDDIDDYIQNALDAIEYANGDASTEWGRQRIASGHPKPFNLRFLEIGNENYQANPREQSDHYAERYRQFHDAIKARYPYMQLIGNVESWGTDHPSWRNSAPVDLLDEHYYRDPAWFAANHDKYDDYDRQGPAIYCGEYAVTSDCGQGNLRAAIGEAAFMLGMEDNSDIVAMASYAPIFVNVHDRRWMPDMIRFDAARSWASPSYYVQSLMAGNVGTEVIPSTVSQPKTEKDTHFRVGFGTWATDAEFRDLTVTNGSGQRLFASTETFTIQNDEATPRTHVFPDVMQSRDYDLTVKARKTGGDEGFLLIFDYLNDKNYKWFNVAGWGNTQHGIELVVGNGKQQPAMQRGSIEDGRWYDLHVSVRGEQISCYLDGKLVGEATVTQPDEIFANAEIDDVSGDCIVKIVNFGQKQQDILVRGLTSLDALTAAGKSVRGIILTGNALDENTADEPEKVVPQHKSIRLTSAADGSIYQAPANSLTILRFPQ